MMLSQNYRELLESFNAEGVRFLVIGGYAVIVHGYPRMTKDLDLWIDPSPDNAEAAVRAIRKCGYGLTPTMEMQLRSPFQILVLDQAPNRIDLITGISDFQFDEMYSNRKIEFCKNIEFPVVSLTDLRTLKTASGRLQDLADLEKLPKS